MGQGSGRIRWGAALIRYSSCPIKFYTLGAKRVTTLPIGSSSSIRCPSGLRPTTANVPLDRRQRDAWVRSSTSTPAALSACTSARPAAGRMDDIAKTHQRRQPRSPGGSRFSKGRGMAHTYSPPTCRHARSSAPTESSRSRNARATRTSSFTPSTARSEARPVERN